MKTRRSFDEVEHSRSARPADFGLFAAPSPVTSVVKTARVLNAFEERRPTSSSLAYVRGKLVELYAERVRNRPPEFHFLTADDAANILEAWPDFPLGGSQSWRGAIFRTKEWERLAGDVPSLREQWNGTPLARWRPRR